MTANARVRRVDITAALAKLGDPSKAVDAILAEIHDLLERVDRRVRLPGDPARLGGMSKARAVAVQNVAALDQVFGPIAQWLAIEKATRALDELEGELERDAIEAFGNSAAAPADAKEGTEAKGHGPREDEATAGG